MGGATLPVPAPARAVRTVQIPRPSGIGNWVRAHRAVFIALGVLAVALWAAIGQANKGRTAEVAVQDYIQLLADGHAEQASALVDPGIPNSQRKLLTDAVYQAAQARLQFVSAEIPTGGITSGAHVPVAVTYSVDGERVQTVMYASEGPKEMGVLKTWTLDPESSLASPATLDLSGVQTVRIGEAEVALADEKDSEYGTTQYLYPCVYQVTPVIKDDYHTAQPETLTVLGRDDDSGSQIAFDTELGQAFTDDVLAQVQARINKCVTPPGNMDSECPYQLQSTKLDALSVISLPDGFEHIDETSFLAEPAKLSYREVPSTFVPSPTDKTFTWEVSGTIDMSSGRPVVTIR